MHRTSSLQKFLSDRQLALFHYYRQMTTISSPCLSVQPKYRQVLLHLAEAATIKIHLSVRFTKNRTKKEFQQRIVLGNLLRKHLVILLRIRSKLLQAFKRANRRAGVFRVYIIIDVDVHRFDRLDEDQNISSLSSYGSVPVNRNIPFCTT